ADRAGQLLMVAQVLRFWPEFALIRDVMESGDYGALLAANFKRVISRPNWSRDNWFADAQKTGGALAGLHLHDSDFLHYLFGTPQAVTSRGLLDPGAMAYYAATTYDFGRADLCISAHSGAVAQPAVPFEHGYDVYFERGMLRHNSSTSPDVQLFAGKEERTL